MDKLNYRKLITSLRQKKYRQKRQLFVAEGVKVVTELLNSSFVLEKLFTTSDLSFELPAEKVTMISAVALEKISRLKSPNKLLGIFQIPSEKPIALTGLTLALDNINDPGNLGTIIRLCDWFGVGQIICSQTTVDCYNPKVVQATMGSLSRVSVSYVNLSLFVAQAKMPVFTTSTDGKNVYKTSLPSEAMLIVGNEANGISPEIRKQIKNNIAIPQFGTLQKTESLNVATATAILLSEFRRCKQF